MLDQERLVEISNNLYRLPAMESRLSKLNSAITNAEREVETLLSKYKAESLDVENLEKESLSVMLLRLVGRYEGKLEKETEEMLQAKLDYDKATERVLELKKERDDLSLRISDLRRDQRLYEEELRKRQDALQRAVSGEKAERFQSLEQEKVFIYKQITEMEEAIRAAQRARQTVDRIQSYLNKADNWATYDVWFKGGIITHMNKYGNIDSAEAEFNRLHSQLRSLKKELKDIQMDLNVGYTGVDSTTRAIDFWFDNIFTDLNVRDRIRSDLDQAGRLAGSLQRLISTLENSKTAAQRKVESIERQKNELLIQV